MTDRTYIRVMDADARAPPRRPASSSIAAPPPKLGGSLAAILCVLIFLLAVPTETDAWYWGSQTFSSFGTQGVRSVIPQYMLWAVLPFAVAVHISTFGMKYYKRSVGLFIPFLIVGFVSGIRGFYPFYSMRLLIFWFACASVGVIAAGGLTHRRAVQLVFYTVLLELILSIILALAFKSAGVVHDPRVAGGSAWRGVFTGHVLLGMVGAWGMLLTFFRKQVGWIPTLAMLACAVLCLYEAHAAGPVVASVSSLGFLAVTAVLRRSTLPTAPKALILALGCLAAAGVTVLFMPVLLSALGRDATLTGRTEIWQLYIPKALEHPILGQGPGSFTSPSQVTAELFFRLADYGAIRTPHNMYIALLGEGGVIGLAAMLGVLFYVAFVLPFRTTSLTALICSASAVLIMTNGWAEATDMVYGSGTALFLFITLLSIREDTQRST